MHARAHAGHRAYPDIPVDPPMYAMPHHHLTSSQDAILEKALAAAVITDVMTASSYIWSPRKRQLPNSNGETRGATDCFRSHPHLLPQAIVLQLLIIGIGLLVLDLVDPIHLTHKAKMDNAWQCSPSRLRLNRRKSPHNPNFLTIM
jgi:hypothetical protein